ncbi:ABC transporter permease [Mesoplasma melaleucae]|uniref:Ribose/galactose ABC transporter permease n=1 Tax=Mesoplasma melaleucae TaxID=81459 RepID=A0A2K8NX58_9MOLU|nr:ABC transporter permease [Mesoplasma melaleucae]ATZ18367.1 ribose/galactose ABC transporter permease [Mesoplasma melaleucae]
MEAIFSLALGFFVVFTLGTISGMFSERSGVINLGIEGFMTIGALAYVSFSFMIKKTTTNYEELHILYLIFGACFSMVVASLFSLLQTLMVLKLETDQIISGTVINLLAQGIALFIVHIEGFGTGGTILGSLSPKLISFNYFIGYAVVILLATFALGLYFTFTKVGTRHIAAGENPQALDAAGIKVNKYRFICITISGAIAGLAGTMFVITQSLQNFNGSVQGLGFIALAIMIIGQWKVSLILMFSIVFSILFSIGQKITGLNALPRALPFIMSLVVMVIASKWSLPPQASGVPFDKTLR